MRRAAFGNAPGLNVNVSGLVRRSVKPGESSNCFATMKAASITDLRDQLRSENLANTEHLHNNIVFGKLLRKCGHLRLKICESFTGTVQLCSRLRQQCSYVINVRKCWNECFGIVIYCIRFAIGVIVSVLVTPTVIFILKSGARYTRYTIAMREFIDKIAPLQVSVRNALRRSEQLINTGKGLIDQ